jgi:hypothetical protein
LIECAAGARISYAADDEATRRKVLETVLCNATVRDGCIASYQYKRPFGVLVKDASGAFEHSWWAM